MEIKFSQNIPQIYNVNNKKPFISKNTGIDCYTSSNKEVSFSGGFGFRQKETTAKTDDKNIPSGFTSDILYGINKVLERKVPAKNLDKIMTAQQLKDYITNLNEENYTLSEKNIKNGIYCADLDYQSNFSSGKENVFDILDKAASYAQEYYKKTGKDFVFALTDRDSIEGIQHALRIFSENPGKYKHMKIIPGVKLSFAHKAPTSIIGYENSEMLIYGFNPYSKNIIDFINNTINKRKEMTINFIKDVYDLYPEFAYSIIEFAEQNNLKYIKDYTVSNLYWRAREYAETKGDTKIKGVNIVPDDVIKQAENILENLKNVYIGSGYKGNSAGGSNIITDSNVNKSIKSVFEKYSTHWDESQGKVVSAAENLYEDMIECFKHEPDKPMMALASPFYFSHYFEKPNTQTYDNVTEFFKTLQENSDGMLYAFESVSPKYKTDLNLSEETVQKFNEEIRTKTHLKEVGGSLINS